jgi:hypothetical protein
VKKRIRKYGFAWSLLLLAVAACDTEKNLEPRNYFLKYYGVQGSQEAVDMVVASDGSIFLLGNSGANTLYLVKTDPEGNSLWESLLLQNGEARAKDIELASDGSLLVLASIQTGPGDKDVLILRVNATDGASLGAPTVYGYAGFVEEPYTITEISDGYIVSGSTNRVLANPLLGDQSDGVMFRFNADLSVYTAPWEERYGPGTVDVVVKTVEVNPGEFVMFGYTNQTDPQDNVNDFNFWVFGVANTGVSGSLNYSLGEPGTDEVLHSVSVVPIQSGSGYLLTGTTESNAPGFFEAYALTLRGGIRTSSTIENIIQKEGTVVTSRLSTDPAVRVLGTPSAKGGFLMLSAFENASNDDIFLTKVDNFLLSTWTETGYNFGGIGNDVPASVADLTDGSILVFGTMVLGDVNGQKKMVLMKVNQVGRFGN